MPPKYRVAETVGTPISPSVPITASGPETMLILFAVLVMLALAAIFLVGVWFFINRLKREQESVSRAENRAASQSGTGSRPDAPPPGQDFMPQADMGVRDD